MPHQQIDSRVGRYGAGALGHLAQATWMSAPITVFRD